MATNLEIDQALLERAMELGGARTKRAVVIAALEEYVCRREQRRILDLFGKCDWDPDYDHKAHRRKR